MAKKKTNLKDEVATLKLCLVETVAMHSMCPVMEIMARKDSAGRTMDPGQLEALMSREILRTIAGISVDDVRSKCMDIISDIADGKGHFAPTELGGSSP